MAKSTTSASCLIGSLVFDQYGDFAEHIILASDLQLVQLSGAMRVQRGNDYIGDTVDYFRASSSSNGDSSSSNPSQTSQPSPSPPPTPSLASSGEDSDSDYGDSVPPMPPENNDVVYSPDDDNNDGASLNDYLPNLGMSINEAMNLIALEQGPFAAEHGKLQILISQVQAKCALPGPNATEQEVEAAAVLDKRCKNIEMICGILEKLEDKVRALYEKGVPMEMKWMKGLKALRSWQRRKASAVDASTDEDDDDDDDDDDDEDPEKPVIYWNTEGSPVLDFSEVDVNYFEEPTANGKRRRVQEKKREKRKKKLAKVSVLAVAWLLNPSQGVTGCTEVLNHVRNTNMASMSELEAHNKRILQQNPKIEILMEKLMYLEGDRWSAGLENSLDRPIQASDDEWAVAAECWKNLKDAHSSWAAIQGTMTIERDANSMTDAYWKEGSAGQCLNTVVIKESELSGRTLTRACLQCPHGHLWIRELQMSAGRAIAMLDSKRAQVLYQRDHQQAENEKIFKQSPQIKQIIQSFKVVDPETGESKGKGKAKAPVYSETQDEYIEALRLWRLMKDPTLHPQNDDFDMAKLELCKFQKDGTPLGSDTLAVIRKLKSYEKIHADKKAKADAEAKAAEIAKAQEAAKQRKRQAEEKKSGKSRFTLPQILNQCHNWKRVIDYHQTQYDKDTTDNQAVDHLLTNLLLAPRFIELHLALFDQKYDEYMGRIEEQEDHFYDLYITSETVWNLYLLIVKFIAAYNSNSSVKAKGKLSYDKDVTYSYADARDACAYFQHVTLLESCKKETDCVWDAKHAFIVYLHTFMVPDRKHLRLLRRLAEEQYAKRHGLPWQHWTRDREDVKVKEWLECWADQKKLDKKEMAEQAYQDQCFEALDKGLPMPKKPVLKQKAGYGSCAKYDPKFKQRNSTVPVSFKPMTKEQRDAQYRKEMRHAIQNGLALPRLPPKFDRVDEWMVKEQARLDRVFAKRKAEALAKGLPPPWRPFLKKKWNADEKKMERQRVENKRRKREYQRLKAEALEKGLPEPPKPKRLVQWRVVYDHDEVMASEQAWLDKEFQRRKAVALAKGLPPPNRLVLWNKKVDGDAGEAMGREQAILNREFQKAKVAALQKGLPPPSRVVLRRMKLPSVDEAMARKQTIMAKRTANTAAENKRRMNKYLKQKAEALTNNLPPPPPPKMVVPKKIGYDGAEVKQKKRDCCPKHRQFADPGAEARKQAEMHMVWHNQRDYALARGLPLPPHPRMLALKKADDREERMARENRRRMEVYPKRKAEALARCLPPPAPPTMLVPKKMALENERRQKEYQKRKAEALAKGLPLPPLPKKLLPKQASPVNERMARKQVELDKEFEKKKAEALAYELPPPKQIVLKKKAVRFNAKTLEDEKRMELELKKRQAEARKKGLPPPTRLIPKRRLKPDPNPQRRVSPKEKEFVEKLLQKRQDEAIAKGLPPPIRLIRKKQSVRSDMITPAEKEKMERELRKRQAEAVVKGLPPPKRLVLRKNVVCVDRRPPEEKELEKRQAEAGANGLPMSTELILENKDDGSLKGKKKEQISAPVPQQSAGSKDFKRMREERQKRRAEANVKSLPPPTQLARKKVDSDNPKPVKLASPKTSVKKGRTLKEYEKRPVFTKKLFVSGQGKRKVILKGVLKRPCWSDPMEAEWMLNELDRRRAHARENGWTGIPEKPVWGLVSNDELARRQKAIDKVFMERKALALEKGLPPPKWVILTREDIGLVKLAPTSHLRPKQLRKGHQQKAAPRGTIIAPLPLRIHDISRSGRVTVGYMAPSRRFIFPSLRPKRPVWGGTMQGPWKNVPFSIAGIGGRGKAKEQLGQGPGKKGKKGKGKGQESDPSPQTPQPPPTPAPLPKLIPGKLELRGSDGKPLAQVAIKRQVLTVEAAKLKAQSAELAQLARAEQEQAASSGSGEKGLGGENDTSTQRLPQQPASDALGTGGGQQGAGRGQDNDTQPQHTLSAGTGALGPGSDFPALQPAGRRTVDAPPPSPLSSGNAWSRGAPDLGSGGPSPQQALPTQPQPQPQPQLQPEQFSDSDGGEEDEDEEDGLPAKSRTSEGYGINGGKKYRYGKGSRERRRERRAYAQRRVRFLAGDGLKASLEGAPGNSGHQSTRTFHPIWGGPAQGSSPAPAPQATQQPGASQEAADTATTAAAATATTTTKRNRQDRHSEAERKVWDERMYGSKGKGK